MGSVVLDLLLIIIFLMMVPIGFFRGGLRELCTAAGLLLGIMMAQQWAVRWSALPKRLFDMSDGAATFLMGVVIAFGVTAIIGYGGSAAFTYQPGPGGRLYGAYLALFNAMVGAGYLIDLYAGTILPTLPGEPITSGIVARTLTSGFDWILLIATIGAGIATIFGMFVRERPESVPGYQPPVQLYQPPAETRPYNPPDSNVVRHPTGPVRITEVSVADVDSPPERPDPSVYGTGWRQTWPDAKPEARPNTAQKGTSSRGGSSSNSSRPGSSSKRVLADWVKDQDS